MVNKIEHSTDKPLPKITFGMIVLNGEPFLRFNIRALYRFAHEIIIVEGASPNSTHTATPDGHSIDDTLEHLRRIQAEQDPEHKITVVTAEDEGYSDGFWRGEKDQQSKAYAKRATGDWLWQIDVDEFYRERDIIDICDFLQKEDPTVVFFYFRMFMYHPKLEVIGVDPEYSKTQPVARLFKWGSGYKYVSHRPPTVIDENGNNLKFSRPITAEQTRKKQWYIWHYPFLYKNQFEAKAAYYEKSSLRDGMCRWAKKARDMEIAKRFKVLWDNFSWLRHLRDEDQPPAIVLDMISSVSDYHIPSHIFTFRYRIKAAVASLYVFWLRVLRNKVFSKRWLYYPYHFRYELNTDKKSNVNFLSDNQKSSLKKMFFFRLIKHLGIIGHRAY